MRWEVRFLIATAGALNVAVVRGLGIHVPGVETALSAIPFF